MSTLEVSQQRYRTTRLLLMQKNHQQSANETNLVVGSTSCWDLRTSLELRTRDIDLSSRATWMRPRPLTTAVAPRWRGGERMPLCSHAARSWPGDILPSRLRQSSLNGCSQQPAGWYPRHAAVCCPNERSVWYFWIRIWTCFKVNAADYITYWLLH